MESDSDWLSQEPFCSTCCQIQEALSLSTNPVKTDKEHLAESKEVIFEGGVAKYDESKGVWSLWSRGRIAWTAHSPRNYKRSLDPAALSAIPSNNLATSQDRNSGPTQWVSDIRKKVYGTGKNDETPPSEMFECILRGIECASMFNESKSDAKNGVSSRFCCRSRGQETSIDLEPLLKFIWENHLKRKAYVDVVHSLINKTVKYCMDFTRQRCAKFQQWDVVLYNVAEDSTNNESLESLPDAMIQFIERCLERKSETSSVLDPRQPDEPLENPAGSHAPTNVREAFPLFSDTPSPSSSVSTKMSVDESESLGPKSLLDSATISCLGDCGNLQASASSTGSSLIPTIQPDRDVPESGVAAKRNGIDGPNDDEADYGVSIQKNQEDSRVSINNEDTQNPSVGKPQPETQAGGLSGNSSRHRKEQILGPATSTADETEDNENEQKELEPRGTVPKQQQPPEEDTKTEAHLCQEFTKTNLSRREGEPPIGQTGNDDNQDEASNDKKKLADEKKTPSGRNRMRATKDRTPVKRKQEPDEEPRRLRRRPRISYSWTEQVKLQTHREATTKAVRTLPKRACKEMGLRSPLGMGNDSDADLGQSDEDYSASAGSSYFDDGSGYRHGENDNNSVAGHPKKRTRGSLVEETPPPRKRTARQEQCESQSGSHTPKSRTTTGGEQVPSPDQSDEHTTPVAKTARREVQKEDVSDGNMSEEKPDNADDSDETNSQQADETSGSSEASDDDLPLSWVPLTHIGHISDYHGHQRRHDVFLPLKFRDSPSETREAVEETLGTSKPELIIVKEDEEEIEADEKLYETAISSYSEKAERERAAKLESSASRANEKSNKESTSSNATTVDLEKIPILFSLEPGESLETSPQGPKSTICHFDPEHPHPGLKPDKAPRFTEVETDTLEFWTDTHTNSGRRKSRTQQLVQQKQASIMMLSELRNTLAFIEEYNKGVSNPDEDEAESSDSDPDNEEVETAEDTSSGDDGNSVATNETEEDAHSSDSVSSNVGDTRNEPSGTTLAPDPDHDDVQFVAAADSDSEAADVEMGRSGTDLNTGHDESVHLPVAGPFSPVRSKRTRMRPARYSDDMMIPQTYESAPVKNPVRRPHENTLVITVENERLSPPVTVIFQPRWSNLSHTRCLNEYQRLQRKIRSPGQYALPANGSIESLSDAIRTILDQDDGNGSSDEEAIKEEKSHIRIAKGYKCKADQERLEKREHEEQRLLHLRKLAYLNRGKRNQSVDPHMERLISHPFEFSLHPNDEKDGGGRDSDDKNDDDNDTIDTPRRNRCRLGPNCKICTLNTLGDKQAATPIFHPAFRQVDLDDIYDDEEDENEESVNGGSGSGGVDSNNESSKSTWQSAKRNKSGSNQKVVVPATAAVSSATTAVVVRRRSRTAALQSSRRESIRHLKEIYNTLEFIKRYNEGLIHTRREKSKAGRKKYSESR